MSERDEYLQEEADKRNSALFRMGMTPYEDFEPWTPSDIQFEFDEYQADREIDQYERYLENRYDGYDDFGI